jgi:hypothetical protein
MTAAAVAAAEAAGWRAGEPAGPAAAAAAAAFSVAAAADRGLKKSCTFGFLTSLQHSGPCTQWQAKQQPQ